MLAQVEPDPTIKEQAAWYDAWGKLKEILARLDRSVVTLRAAERFALSRPNLAPEYRTKMAEIETMRGRAIWLRDTIKSVMSTFGVELSGLGALPALLVWPAVAAGVAWLGGKALDLFQFSQRVAEQQRLEAGGMPPAQAAQIVQSTAAAGSFGAMLGNLGTVLMIGGVLFGAWYLLKNRKRSG